MKNYVIARWLMMAAGTISTIFINLYIFSQTKNVHTNLIYNIFYYGSDPLAALLSGYICKRLSVKFANVLGAVVYAAQLSLLILNPNFIFNHIYVLGIIGGIAAGFYYLSTNVIIQQITSSSNRERFNGALEMIYRFNAIFIPFVSSFIIYYTKTYSWIFLVEIILFLSYALLIITIPIKHEPKEYHPIQSFKDLFNEPDTQKSVLSLGFKGIYDLMNNVLFPIAAYAIILNIRKWGVFTSSLGIIAILTAYFYGKWAKPSKEKYLFRYASLIYFILAALFAFYINMDIFLIFLIANIFISVITNISFSSAYQDVIDEYDELKKEIVEYYLGQEVFINISKSVIILFFILIGLNFDTFSSLKIIIFIMCLMPLSISLIFSMTKLYKEKSIFEKLLNKEM